MAPVAFAADFGAELVLLEYGRIRHKALLLMPASSTSAQNPYGIHLIFKR
jgi:hypothetical protein